jgi:hypothetical protein
LHEDNPDSLIRLERPVEDRGRRGAVDLFISEGPVRTAIELKYWTKKLVLELDDSFSLRDQSAQDTSRYDFWKDISRLERLHLAGRINNGYVVALTNDPGYWKGEGPRTNDEAFRLYEGRVVDRTTFRWKASAAPGSIKGREEAIEIRHRYDSKWLPYSRVAEGSTGEFRYLLMRVPPEPSLGT